MAAFPDGWMSSGQISRDGAFFSFVVLFSVLLIGCLVYSELHEEEARKRSDGERNLMRGALMH